MCAFAYQVGAAVAPHVALIVLDDQVYSGPWDWGRGLRFFTTGALWQLALPMARERELVSDGLSRRLYFRTSDNAATTLLLGARWRPPAAV